MEREITARSWKQHLEWALHYFIFPNSATDLSPCVTFHFAETSKIIIIRNKRNAKYTGASVRALFIRIIDSGEFDHADQTFPTELDMGTCVLKFWDENELNESWPDWERETRQVKCSSKWYTDVLGWSDQKIRREFGLASARGPNITISTPK